MLEHLDTIKIDANDAWALQNLIKTNVMISPMAPFGIKDIMEFRRKLSYALLNMENNVGATTDLEVSDAECWLIDTVLSRDTTTNSKNILLQTWRVMWQRDYEIRLAETSQDKVFNKNMLKGYDGDDTGVHMPA